MAPRAYRLTPVVNFIAPPLTRVHPGVLVAKVGYFGVKYAKVHLVQMGTKPAKVGPLGSKSAKVPKDKKKKKKLSVFNFSAWCNGKMLALSRNLTFGPGFEPAKGTLFFFFPSHKKVFAPRADQIC